jgi:hypothetical protein
VAQSLLLRHQTRLPLALVAQDKSAGVAGRQRLAPHPLQDRLLAVLAEQVPLVLEQQRQQLLELQQENNLAGQVELAISVLGQQVLLELEQPPVTVAQEATVVVVEEPRLLEELEALAVSVLY